MSNKQIKRFTKYQALLEHLKTRGINDSKDFLLLTGKTLSTFVNCWFVVGTTPTIPDSPCEKFREKLQEVVQITPDMKLSTILTLCLVDGNTGYIK
jgi:hypothetical protein